MEGKALLDVSGYTFLWVWGYHWTLRWVKEALHGELVCFHSCSVLQAYFLSLVLVLLNPV